jgi:hypothetical protein
MRKVRLVLEELVVESFAANEPAVAPGTVFGHDSDGTCYQTCEEAPTCNAMNTCDFLSCDGDCGTHFCVTNSPYNSCGAGSCINSCQCVSVPSPC